MRSLLTVKMLILINTKSKYYSGKTTGRLQNKVKVKRTKFSLHMTPPNSFNNKVIREV